MPQSIAFHSYKGGTGKTTIAANLAAFLAKKGHSVALLDLDVYAPSLQSYFEKSPAKWLNDFLSDNADVQDIMIDMTNTISEFSSSGDTRSSTKGKLLVAFSNSKKEEVYKMEGTGGKQDSKLQLLRKFIQLREKLISDYDIDYVILDTSPGIRHWSINALALADVLFLTLKMGDVDIDGTKKIAKEIYGSFTKFGARSYLVLNRVDGYCVPTSDSTQHKSLSGASGYQSVQSVLPQVNEFDIGKMLSEEVGMPVICAIPCYCDIQFSKKEYLTILKYPDHPFAKQIERIAESEHIRV